MGSSGSLIGGSGSGCGGSVGPGGTGTGGGSGKWPGGDGRPGTDIVTRSSMVQSCNNRGSEPRRPDRPRPVFRSRHTSGHL